MPLYAKGRVGTRRKEKGVPYYDGGGGLGQEMVIIKTILLLPWPLGPHAAG